MSAEAGQGKRPLKFNIPQHERLLNIFFTGVRLRKRAREFFAGRSVTDTQFNILALIYDHAEAEVGLSQVELSRMLLVNRSNITSLIDRMERAGSVRRVDDPADRRRKVVQLTPKGRGSLLAIENLYAREVKRIMSVLTEKEQRALDGMLARIKDKL